MNLYLAESLRCLCVLRQIVRAREIEPIRTTFELTEAMFGEKWADGKR